MAWTPSWGQFLDTCHHWHQYRDNHAAELLQHTMQHQLQEAQQAANDEAHLQYKTWLQQGHAKGLKGLFRSLKSSEVPWTRPYRHLEPEQRMTQRLADWGGLWRIRQDNQPVPRTNLKTHHVDLHTLQTVVQTQEIHPGRLASQSPSPLEPRQSKTRSQCHPSGT